MPLGIWVGTGIAVKDLYKKEFPESQSFSSPAGLTTAAILTVSGTTGRYWNCNWHWISRSLSFFFFSKSNKKDKTDG